MKLQKKIKNNEVEKLNKQNIQENDLNLKHSQYIPVWYKKDLNIFAYLTLAFYSLAILAGGIYYGKRNHTGKNTSDLLSIIKSLEIKISALNSIKSNQRSLENDVNTYNKKLHNIEKTITRALDQNHRSSTSSEKLIQLKNQEITQLKKSLKKAELFQKSWKKSGKNNFQSASRTLSSLSKSNVNVLRYEQSLKVKNFKIKQKKELNNFLTFIDLNNSEHKKRYLNLIDSQKLDLYKLEQEYSHQRYKVIKEARMRN